MARKEDSVKKKRNGKAATAQQQQHEYPLPPVLALPAQVPMNSSDNQDYVVLEQEWKSQVLLQNGVELQFILDRFKQIKRNLEKIRLHLEHVESQLSSKPNKEA